MLQFANQFSFVLAGIFVLAVAGILIIRRHRGFHQREMVILLLLAGMIGLGWLVLRPINSPSMNSQQLRAQIGQGIPVLIEFQSPY